jgi:uncharacterized membrane protein (DUF485 family)
MVEAVTAALVLAIWAGLGVSIWQGYQLLRTIFHRLPEARLAFISQTTLKAWVFLFLFWVLASYFLGPVAQGARRAVNLALVTLLLAQVLWTVWAFHRWRPTRRRGNPRASGIPDELDAAELARRRAQADAAKGGPED